MKRIPLHWQIMIALVLGVVWALVAGALGWSEFTVNWIGPFGTIFINLLKLIAIPLILFSIIKGVSEISDVRKLGSIGFKTLFLYVLTTVVAVVTGLTIVNAFKPGKMIDNELRIVNRMSYELWAREHDIALADDQNFLENEAYLKYRDQALALHEKYEASAEKDKIELASSHKSGSPLQILIDVVPSNIFFALSGKGFMLQIIFFAIFFGSVLLMIDPVKAEPIIRLFDGLNEVFLKMVHVVMKGAPFFVFALLAGKISEMAPNNPAMILEIFKGLGWYSLFVLLGLFFMITVFYPLFTRLLAGGPAYVDFFKGIGKAQTVAFSTSSSAATLPVTLDCVNNNLKVPREVSSFVLPIGATVNMDGTSLYISIAVVFLAQFHLIDLTIGQQLIIVMTATLASIGASAVPSAGLIMMIMVLQSVGLNPAWIAIIFPVDRILDMCRTMVNVTGDASVAKIVSRFR